MKQIYDAIIDGGQVRWVGLAPQASGPMRVRVEVDVEGSGHEGLRGQGAYVAEAMRRAVAATGGVTSIHDPIAWQREARVDRPMPGRQ